MEILDKRLIFVTGKGGVGKSTVAAALGVAAARHGKRTIVCEVAQQERMSYVFHREGVGYHETEIGEDLDAFSIDPQRALEEYLQMQIKIKPVYDLMFEPHHAPRPPPPACASWSRSGRCGSWRSSTGV
jgi:anion-transporting  ArsA/GET3 family ATPase